MFMRQKEMFIKQGMDKARDIFVSNGESENLDGECRRASILTLVELYRLGCFKHLIMLESYSNRYEKFNRDPGWYYHVVPLVGNEEGWFIGSGSSCEKGEEWLVGPVTLTEAIWQLTEVEGCTWPSSSYVQELVENGKSEVGFVVDEERYSIPTLVYEDDQVLADITWVRLQENGTPMGSYLD